MIMEKPPGIQLYQVWDDLGGNLRLALIKQLTELEHQLASISFPAFGHLYYMDSIAGKQLIPLDTSTDSASQ